MRLEAMTTMELLQRAKGAKAAMALADSATKNKALLAMADALERHSAQILAANALDLEAARGSVSDVMLDRLALSESRIAGMANRHILVDGTLTECCARHHWFNPECS